MKLISMTDFVFEQSKIVEESEDFLIFKRSFCKIENYANFLKQPLELWMFVACDEDGNVLEEITDLELQTSNDSNCDERDLIQTKYCEYQQAKERCLFEGFEFQDANEDYPMPFVFLGEDVTLYPEIFDETSKVEDLVYYSEFIQLTPIAQKQIGCGH